MNIEPNISKTKITIELLFGKINADIERCNIIGMTRSMVRITDNARALKEQNAMNPTEYLNIIDRIDNILSDASRRCKCGKKT